MIGRQWLDTLWPGSYQNVLLKLDIYFQSTDQGINMYRKPPIYKQHGMVALKFSEMSCQVLNVYWNVYKSKILFMICVYSKIYHRSYICIFFNSLVWQIVHFVPCVYVHTITDYLFYLYMFTCVDSIHLLMCGYDACHITSFVYM